MKLLLIFLASFAGASLGYGLSAYLATPSSLIESRLPWPLPKPLPPVPVPPLAPDDDKWFGRFRASIEDIADKRAEKHANALAEATVAYLDRAEVDKEIVGDPQIVGSVMAALLAGAIVAVVKRIVIGIISALIMAAVIALIVKWWSIIVPVFMLAVTVVAAPVAWTAGKLTAPKESK